MKITNKLNLPPQIINAIGKEKEFIQHRYSVTELLNSTRSIVLTRKYNSEITKDVSESIATLIGSALHKIFEENSEQTLVTELKMEVPFGIDIVVGIADYVDMDNSIIGDYKTTSISKILKKDFADNVQQIKIYAYLFWRIYNKRIKKGKLHYIIKDWSKVKLSTDKSGNYPQSAYYEYSFDISDSDLVEAEKYINWKLKEIHENEFKEDDEVIECSETEKWYSGTTYAIYKKEGDKRAFKVFDNKDEAESLKSEINGILEERKGNCLKCELYCDCAKFCKKRGV